jgi:hypothetical protein
MQRAQATIEYALLVTVLLVGTCLLVRFETPVQWLARAVVHAVAPGHARHGHHGGGGHHGRRRRRPHPCLCPDSSGRDLRSPAAYVVVAGAAPRFATASISAVRLRPVGLVPVWSNQSGEIIE